MSDIAWLFLAVLAMWLVIAGYLLSIGLRQRRLERRLERVDRNAGVEPGERA